MHNKLISVILPVYNCEAYIGEAVDSILQQTYRNIELIVVNDGSTDGTAKILQAYTDPRLVVISQENARIVKALNAGLAVCKGDYIARMDADDVSLPDRFEKELAFLEANPEIMLVGTGSKIVDTQGNTLGYHRHPTRPDELKFYTIFDAYFVHSSVMFRREVRDRIGYYSENTKVHEDFNYWSRITRIYKTANLPEVLLLYRELNSGMSKTSTSLQHEERLRVQRTENVGIYAPGLDPETLKLIVNLRFRLQKVRSPAALLKVKQALDAINKAHCGNDPANRRRIRTLLKSFTFFDLPGKGLMRSLCRMIDRCIIFIISVS